MFSKFSRQTILLLLQRLQIAQTVRANFHNREIPRSSTVKYRGSRSRDKLIWKIQNYKKIYTLADSWLRNRTEAIIYECTRPRLNLSGLRTWADLGQVCRVECQKNWESPVWHFSERRQRKNRKEKIRKTLKIPTVLQEITNHVNAHLNGIKDRLNPSADNYSRNSHVDNTCKTPINAPKPTPRVHAN